MWRAGCARPRMFRVGEYPPPGREGRWNVGSERRIVRCGGVGAAGIPNPNLLTGRPAFILPVLLLAAVCAAASAPVSFAAGGSSKAKLQPWTWDDGWVFSTVPAVSKVKRDGRVVVEFATRRPTLPARVHYGLVAFAGGVERPLYRKHADEKVHGASGAAGGPAGRRRVAFKLRKLEKPAYGLPLIESRGGVVAWRLEFYDAAARRMVVWPGKVAYRRSGRGKKTWYRRVPCVVDGPSVLYEDGGVPVLRWRTDLPCRCLVQVDVDGVTRVIRCSGPRGLEHSIRLEGVDGTRPWKYRIVPGDGWPTPMYEPRPWPARSASSRFSFVFMSDSRSGTAGGDCSVRGVNAAVLRSILSNALCGGADFVLFSGDLVDGYTSSVRHLESQLEGWRSLASPWTARMPVYVGIGNHENASRCWKMEVEPGEYVCATLDRRDPDSVEAVFTRVFRMPSGSSMEGIGAPAPERRTEPGLLENRGPSYGSTVYSFDCGNSHFVVLNCEYWNAGLKPVPWASRKVPWEFALFRVLETVGGVRGGYIMPAQMEWLRRDLDAAEADPCIRHVFVTMHRPLYPAGGHLETGLYWGGLDDPSHPLSDVGAMRRKFVSLLLSHPKVVAFMCGDEHNYSRMRIDSGFFEKYEHRPAPSRAGAFWHLVSGGAGAPYYVKDERAPWTGEVERFSAVPHSCRFVIDGSRVVLEVRAFDGVLIERVRLRCSLAVSRTCLHPWPGAERRRGKAPPRRDGMCGARFFFPPSGVRISSSIHEGECPYGLDIRRTSYGWGRMEDEMRGDARGEKRGFSFVEVLVATAVSVVVLMVLWEVFHQGMVVSAGGDGLEVETLMDTTILVERLHTDIRCVIGMSLEEDGGSLTLACRRENGDYTVRYRMMGRDAEDPDTFLVSRDEREVEGGASGSGPLKHRVYRLAAGKNGEGWSFEGDEYTGEVFLVGPGGLVYRFSVKDSVYASLHANAGRKRRRSGADAPAEGAAGSGAGAEGASASGGELPPGVEDVGEWLMASWPAAVDAPQWSAVRGRDAGREGSAAAPAGGEVKAERLSERDEEASDWLRNVNRYAVNALALNYHFLGGGDESIPSSVASRFRHLRYANTNYMDPRTGMPPMMLDMSDAGVSPERFVGGAREAMIESAEVARLARASLEGMGPLAGSGGGTAAAAGTEGGSELIAKVPYDDGGGDTGAASSDSASSGEGAGGDSPAGGTWGPPAWGGTGGASTSGNGASAAAYSSEGVAEDPSPSIEEVMEKFVRGEYEDNEEVGQAYVEWVERKVPEEKRDLAWEAADELAKAYQAYQESGLSDEDIEEVLRDAAGKLRLASATNLVELLPGYSQKLDELAESVDEVGQEGDQLPDPPAAGGQQAGEQSTDVEGGAEAGGEGEGGDSGDSVSESAQAETSSASDEPSEENSGSASDESGE